jgi:DNA-binding Lrp family transcriptional regulator
MDALEQRLLNDFQRGFPLVPRPFAAIAARIGTTESGVLAALGRLIADGKVSRVGATFAAGRVGAATLAAMRVPRERVAQVAELVNSFPAVNHNYERENDFNLWFVVTGPDELHVDAVVHDIERAARCGRVLSLQMVEPYHIDLGFDLHHGSGKRVPESNEGRGGGGPLPPSSIALEPSARALVSALQEGLPLVAAPYAAVARHLGIAEAQVIATLDGWLATRIINRLGVIVRHHELGFSANAMVVWDVPNVEVQTIGRRVARLPFVTLCYRRLRHLPYWRYNLYCMIHGRDREEVRAQIGELRVTCDMLRHPHQVLFSRRRFKQAGARYFPAAGPVMAHG